MRNISFQFVLGFYTRDEGFRRLHMVINRAIAFFSGILWANLKFLKTICPCFYQFLL
jgi:hypothetical protein